jgi:hypothetical protein
VCLLWDGVRGPPRSAVAPRTGASTTTTALARALPMPSWNVLVVASCWAVQYCLKKSGKKPAITVVAKAELAQS